MTRPVECSDDELPELDVLLKQPIGERTKVSKPLGSSSRKKQDMKPTSTSMANSCQIKSNAQEELNGVLGSYAEKDARPISEILSPWNSPVNKPALLRGPSESIKSIVTPKSSLLEREISVDMTWCKKGPKSDLQRDIDTTSRKPTTGKFPAKQSSAAPLLRPREAKRATMDDSHDQDRRGLVRRPRERVDSTRFSIDSHGTESHDESSSDEGTTTEDDSSEYEGNDQSEPPSDASSEAIGERPSRSASRNSRKMRNPQDGALSARPRQLPQSRRREHDTQAETLGLVDDLSKLQLPAEEESDGYYTPPEFGGSESPCLTPKRKSQSNTRLTSPRKQAHIPKTPHRPSLDAFWSQDLVNDWNDQHSPHKHSLGDPPAREAKALLPKPKPKKETKKSFAARKDDIARDFLAQLDSRITEGKIAELSAATGGVKIVWSKTLNTTAGRANWRRETIRTKTGDGKDVTATVQHKHHAFIELAEKVIDGEDRLLNVIAHEFCHLANFMINGITTNPHGKEFKAWAAKCSREFASQGIQVTTKHTYEIDFKYIWTCDACKAQYKRHSKSVDPSRHRCGTCKGLLVQTKPVPRVAGAGAKPSDYQIFMKEQMKIVRGENPGSPQKDVMRMVADRWSKRVRDKGKSEETREGEVTLQFVDLSLEAGPEN